jgi:hypothetical protein
MRKAMVAVILISVIAFAVAASLILSHPQNQSYKAKIAKFEWTSNWGPGPVGVMWGRGFNITLQNIGDRNIEGLSVDIKLLANNTAIFSETGLYGPGVIGYTAQYNGFDGKLNAGETREIRGGFTTGLDKLDQIRDWGDKTFKVRVMLDNIILDELSLPYT